MSISTCVKVKRHGFGYYSKQIPRASHYRSSQLNNNLFLSCHLYTNAPSLANQDRANTIEHLIS